MPQVLLAFAAGILTILSPCVLPLAPIVIAGGRAKDPLGPLALAAGLALTFGVVGGSLASLGVGLGDTQWVRAIAAAIMIVVGLVMVAPWLSDRSELLLSPSANFANRLAEKLPAAGLLGQFAAGIVLAFAWAPCVGPTLGAAFALAASGGSLAASMTIMAAFALGAAGSLLLAGHGLRRLAGGGRWLAGKTAVVGRGVLGVAFALVGVIILTGFDHRIEASFIDGMPDWLVTFATRL